MFTQFSFYLSQSVSFDRMIQKEESILVGCIVQGGVQS